MHNKIDSVEETRKRDLPAEKSPPPSGIESRVSLAFPRALTRYITTSPPFFARPPDGGGTPRGGQLHKDVRADENI